jgi:hypothetical protein
MVIALAIATPDINPPKTLNPILLAQAVHRGRFDRQLARRVAGDFHRLSVWIEPEFAQSPANLLYKPLFKSVTWPNPHENAVA